MIHILNESYLWIIFHSNRLTIGTGQRRIDADRPSGKTGLNLRVGFRTGSVTRSEPSDRRSQWLGIKPEVSRKSTGSESFTNFTVDEMVNSTNQIFIPMSMTQIRWMETFWFEMQLWETSLELSYLRFLFIRTDRTVEFCCCRNNDCCHGMLRVFVSLTCLSIIYNKARLYFT